MTGIRTRTLDCGGGMPALVAVPDGDHPETARFVRRQLQ